MKVSKSDSNWSTVYNSSPDAPKLICCDMLQQIKKMIQPKLLIMSDFGTQKTVGASNFYSEYIKTLKVQRDCLKIIRKSNSQIPWLKATDTIERGTYIATHGGYVNKTTGMQLYKNAKVLKNDKPTKVEWYIHFNHYAGEDINKWIMTESCKCKGQYAHPFFYLKDTNKNEPNATYVQRSLKYKKMIFSVIYLKATRTIVPGDYILLDNTSINDK